MQTKKALKINILCKIVIYSVNKTPPVVTDGAVP